MIVASSSLLSASKGGVAGNHGTRASVWRTKEKILEWRVFLKNGGI
jgi:hypothetical protein